MPYTREQIEAEMLRRGMPVPTQRQAPTPPKFSRAQLEAEMQRRGVEAPAPGLAPTPAPPELPEDVPFDESLRVTAPPEPDPDRTFVDRAIGVGETLLSAATGATGGTMGMVYGFGNALLKSVIDGTYGTPEGADAVERQAMATSQKFTYEPRSEVGKEYAREVGELVAPLQALGPETQALRAITPISPSTVIRDKLAARITRDAPEIESGVPSSESGVPSALERGRTSTYSSMSDATNPEPLTTAEIGSVARDAAKGGLGAKQARKILAEQAMPDPEILESARRLGIEEYMQTDHISTNQQYRALVQAIKSEPGSKARMDELAGFEQIGKRADSIIDEMGGTQDWSTMSADVKSRMQAIQSDLDVKAEGLYKKLETGIKPKTEVGANNVLSWLNEQADNLGGVEYLSPTEQMIMRRLSPKEGKRVTYALLDRTRKELTAARVKKEGVFKDADSGLIKKLESTLLEDQKIVANAHGLLDTFNDARNAVRIRKGIESDMQSLFGKQLDGTFVGKLAAGVKEIAKGDETKLLKVVEQIPEDMRSQVVATSMEIALGKNARRGDINFSSYANWYENASKNKKAFNSVMQYIPADSRQQLNDLYKVSNGIRNATREFITTGRIMAVQKAVDSADNLASNIFSLAGQATKGAIFEGVASIAGIPGGSGFAAAVASAARSSKDKPRAIRAADKVISSPEFVDLVKNGDAEKFAKSKPFKRFVKETGGVIRAPELWVIGAMLDEGEELEEPEAQALPPTIEPEAPVPQQAPAPATGRVPEMREQIQQQSELLGTRGLLG